MLGLVLFSIMVNDVKPVFNDSLMTKYVDDISCTLPVELGARVTVCSALTALTDVNNIKSWTEQN